VLNDFGQILTFIILAIVFVIVALVAARIIAPKNPTKEKLTTYECGENPIGSPWVRFNIRFYVIALVFIIFDVEVVFLFPWAVVFKQFGIVAFMEMLVFLVILALGFVYIWARGDLRWIRPNPVIPSLNRKIIEGSKEPESKTPIINVNNP
jgi:NADH-quinone oxidoreductase subunit A